jgi:hypothetical protein
MKLHTFFFRTQWHRQRNTVRTFVPRDVQLFLETLSNDLCFFTVVAATFTIRLLPTPEKKSLLCLPTLYSLNNLLYSLLPAACLGKKYILNF